MKTIRMRCYEVGNLETITGEVGGEGGKRCGGREGRKGKVNGEKKILTWNSVLRVLLTGSIVQRRSGHKVVVSFPITFTSLQSFLRFSDKEKKKKTKTIPAET